MLPGGKTFHRWLQYKLKHHHACVWKIRHESVCQEANKTPLSAVSQASSDILYFLVILLGVFISSARTASIFSDQTISKYSCSLFLVVEPTSRFSLASFSDLQCHMSWMF